MKRLGVIIIALVALSLSWSDRSAAAESLSDVLAELPAIRGDAGKARQIEGQVVLVAFFASWCPPCKYEFPHLNSIQQAYGEEGFQVIAVNVFETFDGLSTPEKLERFLDDVKPAFPILEGDAETRRVFGNLDRIPTMFVFGRDGAPVYVFRHERNAEKTHLTEEELRAVVEPLL